MSTAPQNPVFILLGLNYDKNPLCSDFNIHVDDGTNSGFRFLKHHQLFNFQQQVCRQRTAGVTHWTLDVLNMDVILSSLHSADFTDAGHCCSFSTLPGALAF